MSPATPTVHRANLVTAQRTANDFDHAIRYLLDVVHPKAEKVVLMQDNLNTQKPTSLYQEYGKQPADVLVSGT